MHHAIRGASQIFSISGGYVGFATMDYAQSLEFLKSLFPGRAVIYIAEIVEAFGKTDIGARRAIGRKKLPVKKYMGKIGVSLPDLALFLSVGDEDEVTESKRTRKTTVQPAATPTKSPRPIRGMASMVAAIAAARLQADFYNELAREMERRQLEERAKKNDKKRPPRGTMVLRGDSGVAL